MRHSCGFRYSKVLPGALLALVLWAPSALAQSPTPYPPTGASCRTLDSRDVPSTLFSSGDQIVVTGERFPASQVVTVAFVQDSSTELGKVNSDASGNFSTKSAVTRIPRDAKAGSASIRASGGGSNATCAIQVLSTAALPIAGLQNTGYLALWGFALLVFGSFLSVVSFRKWRASRLAAVMAGGGDDRSVLVDTSEWNAIAYIEDDETAQPVAEAKEPRIVEDVEELVAVEDVQEPVLEEDPPEPIITDDGGEAAGTSPTVARLMVETKGWKTR